MRSTLAERSDDDPGLFGRVGGFLSSYAEWHATAIGAFFGVVFGMTGDVRVAVAVVAIVMGKAAVTSPHLRDAAREAAYTAGGFVVGLAAATLL